MRYIPFTAIFVTFVGIPAFAEEGYDACVSVYANSTRNINQEYREQIQVNQLFNEHCEQNGELRTSGGSIDFEGVVKAIPVKIGVSGNSAKEKMQSFCKIAQTYSLNNSAEFNFANQVVVDALSSFNQCLAIASERLVITHSAQGAESVIINGRWRDGITQGVYLDTITFDPNLIGCSSTSFSADGSSETVGDKRLELSKNFNIACRRLPKSQEGDLVYAEANIGLGTSLGTYSIKLYDERILGFTNAQDAIENYEQLSRERDTIASNLSTVTTSLEDVRAAYDRKDAYSVILYHGSTLGLFTQIWNVNPRNFKSVACPKNDAQFNPAMASACESGYSPTYVRMFWDFGGGPCGNTFHELKCVRQ